MPAPSIPAFVVPSFNGAKPKVSKFSNVLALSHFYQSMSSCSVYGNRAPHVKFLLTNKKKGKIARLFYRFIHDQEEDQKFPFLLSNKRLFYRHRPYIQH
jgi:hypothetical protein